MRFRTAQVAIVPMWVIQHPEVHGNATRIAVFAGVQAAHFEMPDREWKSMRELAYATGEMIGLGEEACRKHIAELVVIGAIERHDDGSLGISLGTHIPTLGTTVPKGANHTSTSSSRDTERDTRGVGMEQVVPDLFGEFWHMYPRKVGKPAAIRAWKAHVGNARDNAVLVGLRPWVEYWKARNEPEFVPHPATWLNQERWNDTPPPITAKRNGKPSMMDGLRSLEELYDDAGMLRTS